MDLQFDFILSKEIASTAEVSGSIGYRHRGDPDEYDLSSGIPFGIGAQFPDAQPAEVHDRVVRRDLQQRRGDADGFARACFARRH